MEDEVDSVRVKFKLKYPLSDLPPQELAIQLEDTEATLRAAEEERDAAMGSLKKLYKDLDVSRKNASIDREQVHDLKDAKYKEKYK